VKQFFFQGMLNGYANPEAKTYKNLELLFPKIPIPAPISDGFLLRGSKGTFYSEVIDGDDYLLIDVWFSNKNSDFSGGMTLISIDNQIVWMMNYGGHFTNEAIPTLKLALKTAYEKKLFWGGRGPDKILNGEFWYTNYLVNNDFGSFSGRENIYSAHKPINNWHGQHDYCGFLMVPVEKED